MRLGAQLRSRKGKGRGDLKLLTRVFTKALGSRRTRFFLCGAGREISNNCEVSKIEASEYFHRRFLTTGEEKLVVGSTASKYPDLRSRQTLQAALGGNNWTLNNLFYFLFLPQEKRHVVGSTAENNNLWSCRKKGSKSLGRLRNARFAIASEI